MTEVPLWRTPAMRRLMLVSMLGFTSFFLTLSSLPAWAYLGGVGKGAAGAVTTVMLASTVAVQAMVPALAARLGAGRTLALGLLAMGLPSPLYAVSADVGPLLAISAVRGAGFAVITVLGATLAGTIAPPGRRGESVGLYGLAIAVPNLVALPAGAALTQAGSFGWVAVLGATPLLAVPLTGPLARAAEAERGTGSDEADGSHRRAVRAVLAPSLVLWVVTFTGGGLVSFLPIERPSGALATLALLLFGVTAALARWRAGVVADRVGSRLLLPAAAVGSVVGMLLIAGGLAVASPALVLVGSAVFGTGYGGVQNLTLLIAFARAGERRTATASAVWNAAFDAGTGLGALVVGGVAATGLGIPAAFALSAAAIALSLPLARGTAARG